MPAVEAEAASFDASLAPPRLKVGNVVAAGVAPDAPPAGVVDVVGAFAPPKSVPPNKPPPAAGAAGVVPNVPVVPVVPGAPAVAP